MLGKQEMLDLLRRDVVPALGCTEPVCIALAAAKAASLVGAPVTSVAITCSPNLYKNGMSVGIPGFERVGLDSAAALGACIAEPDRGLSLFEGITPERAAAARALVDSGAVTVNITTEEGTLYAYAQVAGAVGLAQATIRDAHTNIVEASLNGQPVQIATRKLAAADNRAVDQLLGMTFSQIRELVDAASEQELSFLVDAAQTNEKAAEYGRSYDAQTGIARALGQHMAPASRTNTASDLDVIALSSAIELRLAAATEARLDGGLCPVSSGSGAGTKGLVVTIPITEVARQIGASNLQYARALAFGHLVNRYINAKVGKLAAVCTCATAASTAASAAITYLLGGTDQQIGWAIRNMTGTVTGMICDGGKVGCALKVSMSSHAALVSAVLALDNSRLRTSDGVVAATPEQCVANMARIGNPGMLAADREILAIMREKDAASGK